MAIKIEMLKCFTAVVQQGNLSDAAEKLGRTSSAVSMMLKQFEDHIGVPLFETARKSNLTALGALIYEEARREVSHFENSIAVIEGLSRSDLGYLRLVVTPSVAKNLLPQVVLRFTQQFAGVQIDIRDMDSTAIERELLHERADIGIGTLSQVGDLTRRELFSDRFGVVCQKDHQLARDWDQLRWRDMQDHVLIANGLSNLITDPDFAPILAKSRLMVPSITSLLGLVRAGVGISVLPRLAVSQEQDDIAFLPLRDVTARRTVHIASQPHAKLMPAAREFLALIADMQKHGTVFPAS
jgi:DNA-binding transcriptional LysR family regulator